MSALFLLSAACGRLLFFEDVISGFDLARQRKLKILIRGFSMIEQKLKHSVYYHDGKRRFVKKKKVLDSVDLNFQFFSPVFSPAIASPPPPRSASAAPAFFFDSPPSF